LGLKGFRGLTFTGAFLFVGRFLALAKKRFPAARRRIRETTDGVEYDLKPVWTIPRIAFGR